MIVFGCGWNGDKVEEGWARPKTQSCSGVDDVVKLVRVGSSLGQAELGRGGLLCGGFGCVSCFACVWHGLRVKVRFEPAGRAYKSRGPLHDTYATSQVLVMLHLASERYGHTCLRVEQERLAATINQSNLERGDRLKAAFQVRWAEE